MLNYVDICFLHFSPKYFSYLDAAIFHGVRELGEWEEKETTDILAARILRGKCYLNMGRYRFSQAEAEKVLESDPYDSTAMFILGESLYLQCKVNFCCIYMVKSLYM